MKNICLYFQIHQPYRLKRYRFFDIGRDHQYFDDYLNKHIVTKVAKRCYLPMNRVIERLLKKYPDSFKVSFSLTGIVLDQFEMFAPEVIKSFQKLAKTGNVEFLSETYSHSLVALNNPEEFVEQVEQHNQKIESLFGQTPKIFRNTELVYSDEIGRQVAKMKYKAMLAEGAKHVLGWKSPNYLYYNATNPKLKVLLRNYKLSDDIAFRFSNQSWSEWPLTSEKFLKWLDGVEENEDIINLFMDYETFGEHQGEETGIFKFFEALVKGAIKSRGFQFTTPSIAAEKYQPVAPLQVPYPSSWADEERDLSAWLGNDMQKEAFAKLYSLRNMVIQADNKEIYHDWKLLQSSDHFYYMCTKFFSDGAVHHYFNPYDTPYDAFINYMNVISDFASRLERITNRLKYKGVPIEELEGDHLNEAIGTYEDVLRKLRKRRNSFTRKDRRATPPSTDLPEFKSQTKAKGTSKK